MFVNLYDGIPLAMLILWCLFPAFLSRRRRPEAPDPGRRRAWNASKTQTKPKPRFWLFG
jgi:hypothetical protein